ACEVYPNRDDTGGFVVRQPLEQRRVHDREECCIRPDAERQREHGDGGETRSAPEESDRIMNIAKKCAHSKGPQRYGEHCAKVGQVESGKGCEKPAGPGGALAKAAAAMLPLAFA